MPTGRPGAAGGQEAVGHGGGDGVEAGNPSGAGEGPGIMVI